MSLMKSNLSFEEIQMKNPAITQSRWVLRGILLFLILMIYWASVSKVDQITHGRGQVYASARTQVVQTNDGGILRQILVKEGDHVSMGEVVAKMERDRALAGFTAIKSKVSALQITLARLRAEVFGKELSFDDSLLEYHEFIENQNELYQKRKRAIAEDLRILNNSLALAHEELKISEQLEKTGDVGRSEVLRLKRQIVDLQGQIESRKNKYFQDAQAELTKTEEDLSIQQQAMLERETLLTQTDLVAPADGIVKNIRVNTLGGVLKSGDLLLEILPTNSELIAELKLPPAEAGFIKVGLPATLKLDAYDYSIYGSLQGEVSYVSADTLSEMSREGEHVYYIVRIRINDKKITPNKIRELKVSPGMTVTVDIKTGQRSILSFLTKPVTKTLLESFSER